MPEIKNFFDKITSIHPISPEARNALYPHFHLEKFSAGEFLFRQNKRATKIYFMHSGFASVWYNSHKKVTSTFIGPNELIACPDCIFTPNGISKQNFEIHETSTLLSIREGDFYRLIDQYPAFRAITQRLLMGYQNKIREESDWVRTLRPREIEAKLKEKYPGILLKVSKKQISSFMGITEETYYRLKN